MILLLSHLKTFSLTVCNSELQNVLQKHICHTLQCEIRHAMVVVYPPLQKIIPEQCKDNIYCMKARIRCITFCPSEHWLKGWED